MIIADGITSGSSSEFRYVYGTKPINLYVEGVFGSGDISLEAKSPSGEFVKVNDVQITGPGMYVIESFPSVYRLTIDGTATLTAHVVGQIA